MEDKFEYEIVGDTLIIKSGEKVPKSAFCNNKLIRKVCFECEIKVIGESAFEICNIEKIEIPSSVKKIGMSAFAHNKNLKKLILNEGLEVIGAEAFFDCDIEELEIPSSVKVLGNSVFRSNKNLKKLILNEGLEVIGGGAFLGCDIRELEIPSSVKDINDGAFGFNENLKKLILNEGLEFINDKAFWKCDIRELEIPGSVKKVFVQAFYGNKNLKKLILNEGLVFIRFEAFYYCGLEEITIPFTVKEMGTNVFKNNPLKRVYLYEGSLISKLSIEKFDEILENEAKIIIIPKVKMPSKEEIDNRFNNVSDEDRKRYGKELLELISKDDYAENVDNLNKVKELLLKGADTEVVDEYINTGLMICIKKNLISTFNMYMLCKCNIFHRNKLGDDVLITCSIYNRNDMADILIDMGCIINGINKLDETALSIAYENNNSYLINKLESILGIVKVKEETLVEKAKRLLKEYRALEKSK